MRAAGMACMYVYVECRYVVCVCACGYAHAHAHVSVCICVWHVGLEREDHFLQSTTCHVESRMSYLGRGAFLLLCIFILTHAEKVWNAISPFVTTLSHCLLMKEATFPIHNKCLIRC